MSTIKSAIKSDSKRITVPDLAARKGQTPVVALTAYTIQTARALDPHVDILLVGDSLGMVLYGYPSTLPVTLEMMILHGQAVVKGSSHACVIVDMPFGTYQQSPAQAFVNAAELLTRTGASAVKLEGGEIMAETISFLTQRGIPVLGHIGLTPQSVNVLGGYKPRGKDRAEAVRIVNDAKAIAAAGAFGMVIEATDEAIARKITSSLPVLTIGIGASVACDGQILVTEDIVGLAGEFKPRFAKRYTNLGTQLGEAAQAYAADVRARKFPAGTP